MPMGVALWLHLAWGLVCVWVWLLLSGRGSQRMRLTIAALLLVWSMWPSDYSPTYWLGLAFQSPSASTAALCLASIWQRITPGPDGNRHSQVSVPVPSVKTAAAQPQGFGSTNVQSLGRGIQAAGQPALVLTAALGWAGGWLLLLDSFAMLPVALYELGFSVAAIALVLSALFLVLIAALRLGQSVQQLCLFGALALAVLAVFVLFRLPTGNLFDALLDPLLWLGLNLWWARRAFLGIRVLATPTIRA